MTEQPNTIPSWIWIITAYVIPAISALYLVYSNYKKDKATYTKTKAETESIDEESDRLDGKLSLEWVKEFRDSQRESKEQLAVTTALVMDQQKSIADLQLLLQNANIRIIKLETENSDLLRKNILLEERVKVLECENSQLKGVNKC